MKKLLLILLSILLLLSFLSCGKKINPYGKVVSDITTSQLISSDVQNPTNTNIKIVDISQCYGNTMFLDSNGNVYLAGYNMQRNNIYYTPIKIFTNAKSICTQNEDIFPMLSIVDNLGNYYVMGTAPDGKKYEQFTDFMSGVKKAGLGLILKEDNSLYIWGIFKDKYNIGNNIIPELDLNAGTPELLLNNVKSFYGSYLNGCAITINGDLYAWGCFDRGAINFGFKPLKIASNVRDVGSFSDNWWYITDSDTLYQLPVNPGSVSRSDGPEKKTFPTPIKIADNVQTAWLNQNSPAYISTDKTLCMWGFYNSLNTDSTYLKIPEKVAENVTQVAAWYNNMYLDTSGNLITFGKNQSGKLGIGKDGNYFSREKNIILKNITKFYYTNSIFAINKDGEVYMWGENMNFCGGVGQNKNSGGLLDCVNIPIKVEFK